VAAIVLDGLTLNETAAADSVSRGFLNATELADHLVRKGVPFRTAHHTVGEIVLYAISKGKEMSDLELSELRRFSKDIDKDVFDALKLEQTLGSKRSTGGTAPTRVRQALTVARKQLNDRQNRTHKTNRRK
jgi:argininosuccinate lyase